ncbi:unnamed protein product [Calicophoron daubneyi]|uniref:Rhodanese domain-containing protein n=1 Tax=Calicophoron daubneyi TaxID=300641 RepID=A0AAV2TQW9_CALDB
MPLPKQKTDQTQKKIPRNPKYEDVKSTLDTGASISKYMKKLEEQRENFRIRDDEIFKRMKLGTFVQLILQINEIKEQVRNEKNLDKMHITNGHNGHSEGDVPPPVSEPTDDPPPTARSTLQSLVRGVGEFDVFHPVSETAVQDRPVDTETELPYLILDLRDREEYDECHIITALNYPIAMLSRSVNYETPEMLSYRNKSGRIIILYDEDERISPRAATTLVQRGYVNLYLLSGGLRLAWKRFPEGLIIGRMPASVREFLRNKPDRSTPRINSTNARKCRMSASTSRGNSNSRTLTPIIYCQPGSRTTADGSEDFLHEDIVKLSMAIERSEEDGRSIRSGYSRGTNCSACRSENGGRKPFR